MSETSTEPTRITPSANETATSHPSRSTSASFRIIHRNPIFMSGVPRTGTSWAGQVFAIARGIRYVREPMIQSKPPRWEEMSFRYVRSTDDDPLVEEVWSDAISVRNLFRNRWLMSQTRAGITASLCFPLASWSRKTTPP